MKAKIPAELDDTASAEVVRAWLTQLMPDGRCVARVFHESTLITPEDQPTGSDDIERALITLALDSYPAFLLPPEPSPIPLIENYSIRIVSLLHEHSQQTAFTTGVMKDPVLKKAFQQESEHTGRYSMIYRNTGSGGSVQLTMLPDLLLRAAWRHVDAENATPDQFASRALYELALIRRAFAGKQATVAAKLAFTGVLMPPTSRMDIDDGVVRPTTETDRKFAPDSLKAQVTGTDSTGSTVVVNYDGDVILEYKYPYQVRFVKEPLGEATPPIWPEDMRPPSALEQAVLRLRFSLMLAVDRPERAQIVPTWSYVDDPLSSGIGLSWSDPRQAPGFMPIQLTDAEVSVWGEWYRRLSTRRFRR